MRVMLTSGDLTPIQVERFKELIGKPKVEKALFITTAAVPYGLIPKPEWLEDSLRDMRQFAESIDETSLEEGSLIPENLSQYSFIFISGGNSFYLAYRLEETGLGSKIRDFITHDGVYSGSSAGAIILMNNLEHFAPADDPKAAPKLSPGLSVVDFAVVPHADNQKYKAIMEGIAGAYKNEGKEVVLLNDDQVLVINGQSKEVV
ncbi:MAG: Type 1 glutamine amidotransferase-like domain-containing protein [Patescibacteria group bacterium]